MAAITPATAMSATTACTAATGTAMVIATNTAGTITGRITTAAIGPSDDTGSPGGLTAAIDITGDPVHAASTVTINGTAVERSESMRLNYSGNPANITVFRLNSEHNGGSTMAEPRGPDKRPADNANDGKDSGDAGRGYAGFDAFFEDVERRAYRMAVYTLKDEQAAMDAVQDAMLKLVEKYYERPSSEWPALFFTILNNRMIDIQRWGRLREAGGKLVSLFRNHDNGDEDLLETGLGSDNLFGERPEVASGSRDLHKKIDNAITKLSERQRQVFLLREWQGFNVRETSKILGCSEGSVKQHHFRAMQALRRHLAGVWEDEK